MEKPNVGDYIVTYTAGVAKATEKGDALVLCTAIAPSTQDVWNKNILCIKRRWE